MKTPKKGEKGVTGMDCHGQSIQKRKRKQANNENNPSLATSQNQKSRLGLVLEDVTNRPNIEDNEIIDQVTPTKKNRLTVDVGCIGLRMLKNRLRQTANQNIKSDYNTNKLFGCY
ncbi:hypothetical protein Rs2_26259 [Raphanus sativus]|nr:hypothetical protein Rs2_26259 [Raphanus sativus]